MQVLNLCLTYVFIAMGVFSIAYRREMVASSLGKALLVAIAVFWFMRLAEQIAFFGVRGRRTNVFTIVFFLGGMLYLLPLWI